MEQNQENPTQEIKKENIQEVQQQEDESTHISLIQFLDTSKIDYKLTSHRPTKTSQESAEVRGATIASGAKAMLVKDSKTGIFALCVMSAARKLSWKLLRQVMGSKKVQMASQEDVFKITKCIPGAVPPFGSLFNIQTQLDQSLIDQGETINFNCGLRTISVQMKTQDFVNIEKPIICQYTESEE